MSEHEREMRARRQSESAIAPGADPVEPRDPAARAVPRRTSTALLFAIPAILLVLLGLGWMFFMERDGGDERDPAAVEGTSGESGVLNPASDPAAPDAATPPVISDDQLLANADLYTGRTAQLTAVPVISTNGDRSFWAGRPGSRALVVLDESIRNPEDVAPGHRVDLTGRIERAPSGAELDRLNLQGDDRTALEGEEVFIRATEVKVQRHVAAPRSHTP